MAYFYLYGEPPQVACLHTYMELLADTPFLWVVLTVYYRLSQSAQKGGVLQITDFAYSIQLPIPFPAPKGGFNQDAGKVTYIQTSRCLQLGRQRPTSLYG